MSWSSQQVSENHGRKLAELMKTSSQGGEGIAEGIINPETVLSSHIIIRQYLIFLIYHAVQQCYLETKNLDTGRKISPFYLFYMSSAMLLIAMNNI